MGVYMNMFLHLFLLYFYDDAFCHDFCTYVYDTSTDLTYIPHTVSVHIVHACTFK